MESRFLLNSLEIDVTLKFLFTDSKLPDTVTHCDTVCLSQDCTKIDSYVQVQPMLFSHFCIFNSSSLGQLVISYSVEMWTLRLLI